jgi:hypothetical protein
MLLSWVSLFRNAGNNNNKKNQTLTWPTNSMPTYKNANLFCNCNFTLKFICQIDSRWASQPSPGSAAPSWLLCRMWWASHSGNARKSVLGPILGFWENYCFKWTNFYSNHSHSRRKHWLNNCYLKRKSPFSYFSNRQNVIITMTPENILKYQIPNRQSYLLFSTQIDFVISISCYLMCPL